MPDEYLLIRQIQEFFGPGAKPVFWLCNFLWGLDLATRLPVVIFWLGGRKIGFRAALFAAIIGPITIYSKWLIAEPRPFYVSDAFTPLKVSTGFGMPSGNALGIATLMVTIARYARRKWLWLLAIITILLFGLARVYYGVHSPSQVVWGWLAGITIALVLIKLAEPFIRWFRPRSIVFQLAFVLILTSLVTIVGVLIDHFVLTNFVVPTAWIERYNEIAVATNEEDPFSLFDAYDSYVFGGYLFGFGVAGILLLRDTVPEIGSKSGRVLNVGVGIGLYFAYGAIYRSIARPVYETWLFEPYVILAFAAFPLLFFVLTPWVTSRILTLAKPIKG
ncbi:MAG: phosphatase PAP2 family protein [Gammaproteobacteria bacterium]|nr:phosphatase PAP2 family protein [Gammaproteobacteria bacterium]